MIWQIVIDILLMVGMVGGFIAFGIFVLMLVDHLAE